MNILSLIEIPDWQSFENLVADYFREVKQDDEFNIDDVEVLPTGTGSDGGRDILVKFTVDDSVMTFKRVWVVQCKFYEADVNKGHLSDINIPSLLHQYGASGYLLVCKNHYTAPLSDMIEGFNEHCPFKRSYKIWNGSDLLKRVRLKNNIIEHHFPQHFLFLRQEESKTGKILNPPA